MKKLTFFIAALLLSCSAVSAQQAPKLKVAVAAVGDEPAQKRNTLKVLVTKIQEAFVNDGRFIAVTRDQDVLDRIVKAHIYDRSGAVDDNQIIAIGKQLSPIHI
ncbi:hypothetical protein R84B8_01475 [Treponema sp. R8-4-B8]